MEKKTVCIETTVVSCLTARPTSDLVGAAWRKITVDWWETQRRRFDLHASEVTVSEAGRGDAGAAARRLATLADVALLPVTRAAVELSKALVRGDAVPEGAENDALHGGGGGGARCGLSADMELAAFEQRGDEACHAEDLPGMRLRRARDLYSAGIDGRGGDGG